MCQSPSVTTTGVSCTSATQCGTLCVSVPLSPPPPERSFVSQGGSKERKGKVESLPIWIRADEVVKED